MPGEETSGETGMTTGQEHSTSVWKTAEADIVMTNSGEEGD